MPPKNDIPKNWPTSVPYLRTPTYSKALTLSQLKALRTRPVDAVDVPSSTPFGPCQQVKITPITNPPHPANGQSGLFAVKDLPPGSFILPYIGEIHETNDALYGTSDYDLSIDRSADLAVDASRYGNEARFVNDFRGVPGKSEMVKGKGMVTGKAVANAEFREVWDGRPGRGERCMGVWVLPAGKAKKNMGIKKGEEILVSYGRGFWGARTGGDEEEVDWEAEYEKAEAERNAKS